MISQFGPSEIDVARLVTTTGSSSASGAVDGPGVQGRMVQTGVNVVPGRLLLLLLLHLVQLMQLLGRLFQLDVIAAAAIVVTVLLLLLLVVVVMKMILLFNSGGRRCRHRRRCCGQRLRVETRR